MSKYPDITVQHKLESMDEEINAKALELEDAQLELEMLHKKRTAWARRYCAHAKTTTRSIMGKETETNCNLCGLEV